MGVMAGAAVLGDIPVLKEERPCLFGMAAAAGLFLSDPPQVLGV